MPTSIRLAPETEERIRRLASTTGRTKAFYLREMIDRGLDDIEDYYLAADVLERVRKGQEGVHRAGEVRNELGTARRILDYMDHRVAAADPRRVGQPLTGPLGKLWRYRVGQFRVVCDIQDEAVRVLVVRIGRRDEVYR